MAGSGKDDSSLLGLGEISWCKNCHRPLLTTYDGCTDCINFKVSPGTCNLPGCYKLCYFDYRTSHVHGFCGKSHAMEYSSRIQQHRHSSQSHGHSSQSHGSHGNSHGNNGRHYGTHTQWQSDPWNYNVNHGYSTRSHNGPIMFYNRDEPYYEFTNFFEGQPIDLDKVLWRTSEHYFQAQKFVGTPYVEWIRHLERPREAFDVSRDPSVSRWRRSDWEQVKIDVMHKVLLAKFTQNEYLIRLLLSTGNRKLVEHTHRDSFWGDGGDGSGHNHLGKLLMIVRDELRGKLNVGTSVDKNQAGKNLSTQSSVGNTATERRMRTDSGEVSTPSNKHQPEGTQNVTPGKTPEEMHVVPEKNPEEAGRADQKEPEKDQKAVNDSNIEDKNGKDGTMDSSGDNTVTHTDDENMDTDSFPPHLSTGSSQVVPQPGTGGGQEPDRSRGPDGQHVSQNDGEQDEPSNELTNEQQTVQDDPQHEGGVMAKSQETVDKDDMDTT